MRALMTTQSEFSGGNKLLRLQSEFLMLGLGRFGIALKGGLIAYATDRLEDHAEAAAVAGGRAVGVGAVDRVAVMNEYVAGLSRDEGFPLAVRLAVVRDPL